MQQDESQDSPKSVANQVVVLSLRSGLIFAVLITHICWQSECIP